MVHAPSAGFEEGLPECCADCGDEIDPSGASGFAICGGTTLCFTCAEERGGRWDEVRHAWTLSPDYADLAEGYD